MTTLTNQKILELALTSSDPTIRNTVNKLIFALKMKYSAEDLLQFSDIYEFHHSAVLHIPDSNNDVIELSIAWKNEKFACVSLGHQWYSGNASDMVRGESPSHHLIIQETVYEAPK